MRVFALSALAFIAGLVVGWAGALLFYVVGIETKYLYDRDGGVAMGYIFMIGPFFGVVLGTFSAVMVARYLKRRAREQAAAAPSNPPA